MNSTSAELVSIQALCPASAAASALALTSSSVGAAGVSAAAAAASSRRSLFRCRLLGNRPATHHRHAQHAGQGKRQSAIACLSTRDKKFITHVSQFQKDKDSRRTVPGESQKVIQLRPHGNQTTSVNATIEINITQHRKSCAAVDDELNSKDLKRVVWQLCTTSAKFNNTKTDDTASL